MPQNASAPSAGDVGSPRLLVSRRALLFNLRQLRRRAGGGTRVCAVVKADAYGHGAHDVCDVLTNFYTPDLPTPAVDALAVATVEEADALPDFEVPVIVLRPVECVYLGNNRKQLETALRRGFMLSLISPAAADDVARLADRLRVRANVQIMLDTGMAREGCDLAALPALVERILKLPQLRLVALASHFTDGECADEPFSDEQLRLYHEAVDPLASRLPAGVVKHVANSGGTFFAEDGAMDMVRSGLSLYGIDPTLSPCTERPLRPVGKWVAPLLHVRDVKIGTTCGYNRTWRATRDSRIGLIPVGYADGYRRSLGGQAVVRIGQRFAPVIGRVSMDYITVDLTDLPHVRAGDEVVLMDDDPASRCSVYRLAELSDTIPYEFFCGIGRRVQRVAVEPSDGQLSTEEMESSERSEPSDHGDRPGSDDDNAAAA